MNVFERLISSYKKFSEGKFFKRLKVEELVVNQKNLELAYDKEQEIEPTTELNMEQNPNSEFKQKLSAKEKEFDEREKELFTEQIVSSITNTRLQWKNLTKESIEEVAKQVLSEEFKKQIKKDVCSEKYKYFRYGDFIKVQKSYSTKETYTYALRILKKWSEMHDLHFAVLTSEECDKFIVYLIEKGYSTSYINTVCNICSSFYAYLERIDPEFFKNTFRGTTAKPKIKPSRPIVIPTEKEVEEMIKRFPPIEAGVIAVCAYRGLRIGSFPSLKRKNDGMYEFESKEKFYPKIDLGEKVIKILKKLNLNLDFPFKYLNISVAKRMMNYRLKKIKEKEGGIIKEIYSHHDLRHFFSINTYKLSKDIYKLSKLLGHASVSTTEKYLKCMGEEV
jgi:site-specific recombinase XerD